MSDLIKVASSSAEQLPRVCDLDPYLLGATNSVFGRDGHYGNGDGYVARTANEVDRRLARELTGHRLVVVVGPSKAGKTRSLYEAVRAVYPTARVAWPCIGTLDVFVADQRIHGFEGVLVVWLDDLHEYLTGTAALTPGLLSKLMSRPGRTIVVATLRSEMRSQLRGGGELHADIRRLLGQASTIEMASTAEDPVETAAANYAYPEQVRAGYGLGEELAGAPELLTCYDDARAADPVLHTVISTAVDWARIGRVDPIPEPVLLALVRQRLRNTRPELDVDDGAVTAAITHARTPSPGAGRTAALLTANLDDQGVRGYRPFDYLVAADDGQHHSARPVPDGFWTDATRDATAAILFEVGNGAYFRNNHKLATDLWQKAADQGHTPAMTNLGTVLHYRGDLEEAETWWHCAAAAGNTTAMAKLGTVLQYRGDLEEAETWYRHAAADGHTNAMTALGILLQLRGDLEEAETWLRRAAKDGETNAITVLGILLRQRGDLEEAETWLRRAAEDGETNAMTNLGTVLHERGDLDEAETCWRRAAEDGNTDAMTNLGILLHERGDLDEAETWYRRAAEDGETTAMTNLGILLQERGDLDEAETCWRHAATDGNTTSITNLGILLHERGDLEEAETWYRRAAEDGNTDAMTNLGILLHERGDLEEAETWYRRAAEDGNTDAMTSLGILLHERGDLDNGSSAP
ncbi:tetratricopeptide repeat protein [Nocardia sp. A7]|uniref:tetratricopeptide repeat protein n=1 Tax=Nocardia sp. A7 TaxID=2789274 RepID=UPI00397B7BE7